MSSVHCNLVYKICCIRFLYTVSLARVGKKENIPMYELIEIKDGSVLILLREEKLKRALGWFS